jgi:hypothetical protein
MWQIPGTGIYVALVIRDFPAGHGRIFEVADSLGDDNHLLAVSLA